MDTSNAHLYLPAVEALRDKELQWLNPSTGKWKDIEFTKFEYTPDCYRRNPKPREFYVKVCDGAPLEIECTEAEISSLCANCRIIRVREVIE